MAAHRRRRRRTSMVTLVWTPMDVENLHDEHDGSLFLSVEQYVKGSICRMAVGNGSRSTRVVRGLYSVSCPERCIHKGAIKPSVCPVEAEREAWSFPSGSAASLWPNHCCPISHVASEQINLNRVNRSRCECAVGVLLKTIHDCVSRDDRPRISLHTDVE